MVTKKESTREVKCKHYLGLSLCAENELQEQATCEHCDNYEPEEVGV